MPAARGGSPNQADSRTQSRSKAPASARQRPQQGAPAAGAPARAVALSPKLTLAGAGVILIAALSVTLATGHRGERLVQSIGQAVDGQFGKAGFRLRTVHVEGASAMATPDIVRAAGIYKDQPMLGLDLEDLRARVEQVGWVKEARVVRLLPDTLMVSVEERRQLAVWQSGGKSLVIDERGQVIPEANAARFPTLPLVVGDGGAEHAPGILPILAQRPKLMSHMDALIRVDDRRWDLRMKDGSLIQLPAVDEEQALMQLEALDQRQHILDLGFDRIDLRNPDVVAVRPRQQQDPALTPQNAVQTAPANAPINAAAPVVAAASDTENG